MPVSPCVCCCCTCAKALPSLASSYTIDLAGTWDLTGCDPNVAACVGIGDEVDFLAEQDEGTCQFGIAGFATGEFCLSGNSVSGIVIALDEVTEPCGTWLIEIIFFNDIDVPGSEPVSVVYRQRSPRCGDPTGIYDFESVTCALATIPETIEVS